MADQVLERLVLAPDSIDQRTAWVRLTARYGLTTASLHVAALAQLLKVTLRGVADREAADLHQSVLHRGYSAIRRHERSFWD